MDDIPTNAVSTPRVARAITMLPSRTDADASPHSTRTLRQQSSAERRQGSSPQNAVAALAAALESAAQRLDHFTFSAHTPAPVCAEYKIRLAESKRISNGPDAVNSGGSPPSAVHVTPSVSGVTMTLPPK